MPYLILLVILAGSLIAIQGGVNSNLAVYLNHPLQAAFISFFVGALCLCSAIVFLNIGFPKLQQLASTPKHLFFGGLLGASFITLSIFSIPKIGLANFVLTCFAGQILTSLIIDHFGLLNVPVQPIDKYRLAGAATMFVGLVLINKKHLF